jgi:hypothetical protein
MVMFERPDQPHDDDLIDEVAAFPPLPPARLPAEIRAPINYNRDVLGVDVTTTREENQSINMDVFNIGIDRKCEVSFWDRCYEHNFYV